MIEPIHIISLGAGVQSSTMALMAAAGEITPMPKCAIFADTQAEPKSVYVWLDWLEKKLPFPVYRVTAGNLEEDSLRIRQRKDGLGSWVPSGVPHYSTNADGSKGHGPRQCTGDFKLNPLLKEQRRLVANQMKMWRRSHKTALKSLALFESKLRAYKRALKLGLYPGAYPDRPDWAWIECQTDPLAISMIGISLDESSRVKDPLRPWINNLYPLIDKRITRKNCLAWMMAHGFPMPPRSACVFCPYHSNSEWLRLKTYEPLEFARAVRFEKAYQAAKALTVSKKHFKPFLHNSRIPLDLVDFTPNEETPDLFNNECEGMCGV